MHLPLPHGSIQSVYRNVETDISKTHLRLPSLIQCLNLKKNNLENIYPTQVIRANLGCLQKHKTIKQQ